MLKVCEICGSKETTENSDDQEIMSSIILHVCESCRDDRKWEHFEEHGF